MKIMAVDDVLLIRKLTGKVVEALGGELLEASDGIEALLTLEKTGGNIDLIILDWNMPKMDGFEFLTNIKKNEKFSRIPVIMATTEGEKDKIIKAIQAGASNYLVKPFSEQMLAKKILESLGMGYEYDIFNRCLSEAVSAVIASTTGLEVSEHYGGLEEKPGQRVVFSGQIVVTGQVNALAFLIMDKEAALKTVSLATRTPAGDLTSDQFFSGMAGIINKVTARARKTLAGMNLQWDISFPFVSIAFVEEERHTQQKEVFTIINKYQADDVKATLKMYYI